MFGQSATEAQAAQSAQVEPQTTQLVTLQSATGLNAGDPARITIEKKNWVWTTTKSPITWQTSACPLVGKERNISDIIYISRTDSGL